MRKRETAIAKARVAGYHGDYDTFMRAYVGSRVSYQVMQKAFADGVRAKENGAHCSCIECKRKAA